MFRIIVKEFENDQLYNVSVFNNSDVLEIEHDLVYMQAIDLITEFINKYDIDSESFVINKVFNDEGLKQTLTETVEEFLN